MGLDLSNLSQLQSQFTDRHIGPTSPEIEAMLGQLAYEDLDQLIDSAVPTAIRMSEKLDLPSGLSEHDALAKLQTLARKNETFRSLIGLGYADTITPTVIQRNILENPGWYTQYTPYQSEISQGRLEALLNFQTVVADLTGLPIANASLLDEATAAAEAMSMLYGGKDRSTCDTFFVDERIHPQVLSVIETRAEPLGIPVVTFDLETVSFAEKPFAMLLAYPGTGGEVRNLEPTVTEAKRLGVRVAVCTDLLALTLLRSPGEIGADVAVGSSQRFGVPLGFGGPHAAFFATTEAFKRKIPGRIIGVSKDSAGQTALRMALQTREQHIRRDKATSNICTSQVLLAIMAGMYAVYHGPKGLREIASRVHGLATIFAKGIEGLQLPIQGMFFDTVQLPLGTARCERVLAEALKLRFNLRRLDNETISITFDEKSTVSEVEQLWNVVAQCVGEEPPLSFHEIGKTAESSISDAVLRTSAFLENKVFNSFHSETDMLRYIKRLEAKDLSLTQTMIPLGSCTMKLNATSELMPISWNEFSGLHPFAPMSQAKGYVELFAELEDQLAKCTGFAGISLQPNSGAQGEYAGLLVIRAFHHSKGEEHRRVCLIPQSAHGTNPASAKMAGMKVVAVNCDKIGNIDLADLKTKAHSHREELAALMVTYPSTHGVFESAIKDICAVVHEAGGQVYMDGANMNAQIGLCQPGKFGPDVCHLNLHKTFCIPHGGGGPGVGPIGVASHLVDFLPGHTLQDTGGSKSVGPVSAAPWGSPGILPIPLMYIWMMGGPGLTQATKVAILNANYIAKRVHEHFPVLYRGDSGLVAHECIIDLRPLKASAGIEVEDVAKRLMDYGFHAPTISFPVPGTMMIEPTESEGLAELDRFCDAMIAIREEIKAIERGEVSRTNNLLKNAPHTAASIAASDWDRPYDRNAAVFPSHSTRHHKFWPPVGRVDNAHGDRNLICTCGSLEDYLE